jgi:cytochrome c556
MPRIVKSATLIAFLTLVGCTAVDKAPSADAQLEEAPAQPDPGTLKAVMAGIAADMDSVHGGLWAEDLVQVERAATSIAGHPHVSADERSRIQQILGADFGDFVAGDKRVHNAAVALAAAAAANDMANVLSPLGELESGCVGCHSTFRDRLKSDQ